MADELSISLTIDSPDGSTETKEFSSSDPIMIGSGGSAHVKLGDDDVSSLHCMLKPAPAGGLLVLDLGSDEGTEVNGKEITGETPLDDGDTLTVGGTRIAVHFGGDMLAPTVPIRGAGAPAGVSMPGMPGHGGADAEMTAPDQAAPPDVTAPGGAPEPEKAPVAKEAKPEKAAPRPKKSEPKAAKAEAKAEPKPAKAEAKSAPKADDKKAAKADDKKAAKADDKKAAKADDKKAAKADDKKAAKADDKKAAKAEKKSAPKSAPKAEKPRAEAALPDRASAPAADAATLVQSVPAAGDLDPALGADEKPTDKQRVDVTMMWGGSVMGVHRLSDGGSITVGEAGAASFQVSDPSIPSPLYELVTMKGGAAVVHVSSGMSATVDGKPASGQVNVDLGQTVRVTVGAVEFVVQYAKRYAGLRLGLLATLDYLYSKVLALALIFQLGLVVAMLITPHFEEEEDEDLLANLNEFSALILTKKEKKKEKKQDLSGKKGAKRKDEEGLFGKKDKPKEDKAASKKGAPTVDKDKREEDRKIAMDALAALGLTGPKGAVSNVFGPGGLGTGINNALGGLRGAAMGDAGGAGGLGSRGTGAGGGGNALGIGGIGSGTGRGSGGRGGVDLGGRGKGMTRIKPGKVVYKGSLSREEIQRVVRRAMNQIKFCYEKQLNKDPNLQGKLVIAWTIAGTGLVSSAKPAQDTMGSKPVASCVTRVIKRLRFPKPRGGGSVFVNYPFVFSPG